MKLTFLENWISNCRLNRKILGLSLTLIVILGVQSHAQDITQTIRGSIKDKDSHMTLPGATVAVYKDSTLITGSTTDLDGYYRIENVPVGRYTIIASFLGYRQMVIPNVIVNSGKEVIMPLEMEESVINMKTVEITATRNKGEALNEMATVSARTFAVEETERYAGSRGDPARMASNFAGVQGSNDSSNDIVVRGNSPLGLLWRLEGVNIPNPNHFGISGNSGGPVTMLNNKVLSTSDFMTGAFPAEYGNSVAGVFDLKMRNGNNEKHEFSGQWGFLGTEINAEGPISRKNRSSYLINYRYSTLAIFHALGIDIGTDAVPQYQDLSFKFNFPTKKWGNISFFGIGGLSKIDIIKSEETDPDKVDVYGNDDVDEYFRTGMGVVGLNYTKSLGSKTYFKLTLSSSLENQRNVQEKFLRHVENGVFVKDTMFDKLGYTFYQSKHSASFFVSKKSSKRHTVKAGLFADLYRFDLNDSILNEDTTDTRWETRLNYTGSAYLLQPYIQWKYKITEDLTLNAGVHGQFFTLNNSQSIEPRVGLKWRFKPSQSLSFGFGMHSQMIPTYVCFAQQLETLNIGNVVYNYYVQPNINVDFMHSAHYVLAWDNSLAGNLRIRTETYYQKLSNVPVEVKTSSYSILNQGDDLNRFFPDSLVNAGKGVNYGIELTLEKFFSKTYFIMMSASLYESKYTGSDNIEYSTNFNGNYVVNLLGTKEFHWGEKNNTTFGVGGKITWAGGKRYTPIDVDSSDVVGYAIYDDSQRNSQQFKDYFRADIKLVYKINSRKLMHEIGLDLVNIFNVKNVLKQTYIGGNPAVREEYQLGFLPIFYYRVDF